MELYKNFIDFVDVNLIYCLIPIVLSLFLIKLIFKNRFDTRKALNVVRWIIVVYTILYLASFVFNMVVDAHFFQEMKTFLDRATGPYKAAYWFMMLSSSVLPFALLFKKLSQSTLFVLLVAFLMKAGLYFERFVIIVTSMQRDSLPTSYKSDSSSNDFVEAVLQGLAMLTVQGFIIAMLLLGFFELIKRKK
jgi:hypothetical protein